MGKKTTPAADEDLDQYIRAGATDDPELDLEGGDFGDELPAGDAPEPESEAAADPEPEADSDSDSDSEPEPEADTDPDPEPEPEPEADPAPEPEARPDPVIPKARFDEINERRKAAERRLAEIEAERQAAEKAVEFDFEAREKDYMDAVIDGDTDKALAIRREIRAAEQALVEQRLNESQVRTREATKAELALQETIEQLQSQYPVFDGESERFDEAATTEALELFEVYKARGYAPASAMRKAASLVIKDLGLERPAEPAPTPPPEQSRPKPEQVAHKLKVAAQQPPESPARQVNDKRDILRMSEAEFDKLSEDELRVLRGDVL